MEVERKCIVSGEVKSADELLRFTLVEGLGIVPDFKAKLPGKGIYVSNSKSLLKTAIEKNLFSKGYKKNIKTSIDLIETVENILHKNGLDAISLARKAGVLITGFEKVVEALKKDKVAFILEAKDAGDDGHNKIVSKAKHLEIFDLYTTDELDIALDKVNTVHAAFERSPMAKMVLVKLKRFQTFLNS